MAYNHKQAEKKWLKWKQKEEDQLREAGFSEDNIQKLRTYDKEQFNRERRYLQRWTDAPEAAEGHIQEEVEPFPQTPDKLLDSIENEGLLEVLRTSDEITLKVILLRMQGYSSKEIARRMGMTANAVDLRIHKLKGKIKKIF